MGYRVASVPYVNAIPLAHPLESRDDVTVVYDVPSRLPALLESGEVDAILVSSIYALMNPGLRLVQGAAVGSDGPVTSVKIFSKVPLRAVETMALDASSMTSNKLAQVLVREAGGSPQFVTMAPNLEAMLAECDACVLIGDPGMAAQAGQLLEYDLGEEWTNLTGLPFLWAGWVGGERLTPALASILLEAAEASGCGRNATQTGLLEEMISHSQAQTGFSRERVTDYLTHVMVYNWSSRMLEGYREYAKRINAPYWPELISPAATAKA